MREKPAEELYDEELYDDESDWEHDCGLAEDGQCSLAGTEWCDFECPNRNSEMFAGSEAWRKKHGWTSEPDYIAQTGETRTREEREAWLRARADEAKQEGCVHARATLSDDHSLLLLEAWKETPADEGPPRFSYAARNEGESGQ